MANKNLFKSLRANVPVTDTRNKAGGKAYSMDFKHALAQLASTGCFNDTFYVSGEQQLKDILVLCEKLSPEFIAKTAIYARERAYMKDMPAMLCAVLAKRSDLFAKVLPRVVDNPKMLKNVVQMIRSGTTGRKSLGTAPKRAIQEILSSWDDKTLFRGSVGNNPSLSDVIKMVHPRPETESRKALYGWLTGAMTKDKYEAYSGKNKEKKYWYDPNQLPPSVQAFEAFKKGSGEIPDVPFEMLTAMPLTESQWVQIAKNASWTQTRMNLNTFVRHGVFKTAGMDRLVADKLKNKDLIAKAKVFPYQLMVAFINCDEGVPSVVKNALQDAMETATANVPALDGKVYIFPDVSGSMSSPVTGHRVGATSKVRCIDVAGLVASTILRKNTDAEVIPFEGSVVDITRLQMNSFDSIMTNAQKLAGIGGGSTNCSAPLALLNTRKAKGDLVIYVSDNESWAASRPFGRGTATMAQWKVFQARNPKAKMVNIDIIPNTTTQANSNKNILNIGGFSDQVFSVIQSFLTDGLEGDLWTQKIENIVL